MAITNVQHPSFSTTSPCAVPIASTAAGNVLTADVYWNSATLTMAVSDNKGNTWTPLGSPKVGSGALASWSLQSFVCLAPAAATTTVTATESASGTNNTAMVVREWTGFVSTKSVDGSPVYTNVNGAAPTAGPFSTSIPTALIVAADLTANSMTAIMSAPFTDQSGASGDPAWGSNSYGFEVVSVTQSGISATFHCVSGDNITSIYAIGDGGSAAPSPPQKFRPLMLGLTMMSPAVRSGLWLPATLQYGGLVAGTAWTNPLSDSITMTDAIINNVGLKKSDSETLTDSFARTWVAFKTFADSTTLTDAIIKNFGKVQADTETLTDSIVKNVASKRADSITMTDTLAKNFGLSRGDSVTCTDSLGHTWVIARSFSDSITATDAIGNNVSLGKADTVTLTDLLTTTSGKQILLSDTISLTDAIVKNIGSVRADTVSLADVFSRSAVFQRSLTDTVTMSDALAKAMGISKTDSVSLTDALGKGTGKVVADSTTLTDAVAKAVGLTKSDSVTITEALAKNAAHKLADAVTLTDVATPVLSGAGNNWTLNLADAITLADALTRTLSNQGAGTGTTGRARNIFLSRFGIY
jgi:hypothetical protein